MTYASTHCTECSRFDHKTELCTKFGQRPPAQTIVDGCAEFDLDMPF